MFIYTFNTRNFKRLKVKYSETSIILFTNKTNCYSSVSFPNNTIIYDNPHIVKQEILQANKAKAGVYKWVNKVNGKSYIGSSVNLNIRLYHYLSDNFLVKKTLTSKSVIYNGLLTYGYENFTLEILEYCDRSIVINREQFFIDHFKPEYNILSKAGSSLGFKHSEETLSTFRSRMLSNEALSNLRKAKVGATLSPLAKANQLLKVSHVITIKHTQTGSTKEYPSIRAAARELQVSHATLLNYIDKDKLFKGKFILKNKQT